MRSAVVLFILVMLVFPAKAQEEPVKRDYINQPENVDRLIETFRQSNQRRGMQGFRVQIYTASGNRSRLLTERVKAEFDAAYPGVNSYITYDEPYFKLRVGDFRTRLDAQRFERQISSKYIYATVVVDRINLPRLGDPVILPVIRTQPED